MAEGNESQLVGWLGGRGGLGEAAGVNDPQPAEWLKGKEWEWVGAMGLNWLDVLGVGDEHREGCWWP